MKSDFEKKFYEKIFLILILILPFLTSCLAQETDDAAARMRETVDFLAEDAFPRDFTSEKQADVLAFLENAFQEAGLDVSKQEYRVNDRTCVNLSGILRGKTRARVIVGAHYDAVEETPGADDNASALAVLLELVRALKSGPKLGFDVEFVAWNTEEPPHFRTKRMGSYVHAARLRREKTRVLALVCMDCVGYYRDAPDTQSYPLNSMKYLYDSRGDFLAILGETGDLPALTAVRARMEAAGLKSRVLALPAARRDVLDYSDHLNYLGMGFPLIFLTDTAFYRNPHYHEPSDTPDTLDFDRLALLVPGLLAYLETLDEPVEE